jgi:hypothetical protein
MKLLLFYVSLIPLTFGIYETYLWMVKPELSVNYSKGGGFKTDDILGYAPLKNSSASHSKYYKNEVIFDVVYTIDSNGLRISPPYNSKNNTGCILFFGGSFTFGEGVNDEETMPYITGIKTHGKYRVYNFGYRGYGPHQMLSAIEKGLVATIIECKPKYVIYQALVPHIARSAGLEKWTRHHPKYILKKNGEIIYKGHYDDEKRPFIIKMIFELKKSLILERIFNRNFSRGHINLFIEIVNTSRQMIEARYPGCEFHVIFWNDKNFKDYKEVLEKLKRKKIRIHLITDILPDFYEKESEYRISKYDRHPTPLANEIIAEYVARKIIKE